MESSLSCQMYEDQRPTVDDPEGHQNTTPSDDPPSRATVGRSVNFETLRENARR